MNSAAEAMRVGPRPEREHLADDADRIIVEVRDGVVSLHYRGNDPETRYRPRERSVWHKIRESFRMG